VLGGGRGDAAEEVAEAAGDFGIFERFVDKFGEAIFDGDARAKIFGEVRVLGADVVRQFDGALHRGEGARLERFLREADESGADEALHF